MQVAQTILQQLGGNKFAVMTGARHFLDCGNALAFRLPSNFAKDGINAIRITLEDSDTYAVQFGKVRGHSHKVIAEKTGIYCDMLPEVFREATGLETRMPRVFCAASGRQINA